MTRAGPRPFSDRLLTWWDRHGRKDLPWQHPRTPYRVWISEIMLQQTQVAAVIPYFQRWVDTFPDIETLAMAPLDDVLAHWSGLGYYARARNIHKAAAHCMTRHNGELPAGAEALAALPGIGASTANAIVSQSTDRPAAVLDGNVRRTLARHAAVKGWTGKASVQRILWKEAESRLPEGRGADYTQAIMDLGAMVCRRSKPDCEQCPVNDDCEALKSGLVDSLPSPRPANKVSERTVHMLILQDARGQVLLEKRPPAGIWGGLWSLPEGKSVESIASDLGVSTEKRAGLPHIEHRLSHVRMTIRPTMATAADAGQLKCSGRFGWFDLSQVKALGVPKPVTELLNRLHDGDFT